MEFIKAITRNQSFKNKIKDNDARNKQFLENLMKSQERWKTENVTNY